MTSSVSICNNALVALGEEPINSLTETNRNAQACNQIYDGGRRHLLRTYPFKFAKTKRDLTPLVATPIANFQYAFQLPADLVRLIEVHGTNSWEVVGGELHTNMKNTTITYIFDNKNPNTYDPTFVEMFSRFIQAKIARRITGSADEAKFAYSLFDIAWEQAVALDSQESVGEQYGVYDDSLRKVRY